MMNGLYVEDKCGDISVGKIAEYDFLLAKAEDPDTFALKWVQRAYQAHVPCIMFYENQIEPYLEMTINTAKWPSLDKDPNMMAIDRYLGTPRRAVHAIVLSSSNEKFTPNWLITHNQYMLDNIWSRYHLPVYLYMNGNPWGTSSPDERMALNMFTTKQEGMSTADFDSTHYLKPMFPKWLLEKTGQTQLEMKKWHFWLHSYNTLDKTINVRYNGDLYADIDYKQTVSTPVPTNPVIPPTSDTLEQKVDKILAILETHFK